MPGEQLARLLKRPQRPAVETLVINGDPESVREGLSRLLSGALMSRLNEDNRGSVQIVLAEVLNNIAEHAYARFPGQIEVLVEDRDSALYFLIRDAGLPMPGGKLPGGKLSEATTLEDLPEGGFGWFLIRALTTELTYQRQGEVNVLSYCIIVDDRG